MLLDRLRQAVEATSNALAHFDRTVTVKCEVRLGRALVLAQEIPEAARVLGTAARQARLTPGSRAPPGHCCNPGNTPPVTELDTQLHAHGPPGP
ncbi:MAG: hypothetical protein ACRDTE_28380 [Pseudonocardiaceae bacterium]